MQRRVASKERPRRRLIGAQPSRHGLTESFMIDSFEHQAVFFMTKARVLRANRAAGVLPFRDLT